jgi:Domain of unknown function (DUF4349)
MHSPDVVAPARLEELLTGSFPETHAEARLQGLARELRSVSVTAPSSLRGRITELGARPRRARFAPSRRLVLAVAAAVLAAAAVAFTGVRLTGQEGVDSGASALRQTERNVPPAPRQLNEAAGKPYAPPLVNDASGRAQDVNMWVDLRVPKADDVSFASQEAARITRELGGVVASSAVSTSGAQGSAQLTLRIPVQKVNDALVRLTALGTVTGQRVDTRDLQGPIDTLSRRIERLRSQIRIAEARLASGTLDAEEELQVKIQLEHLRSRLAAAKREHAAIAREVAMADLSLKLHTPVEGGVGKSEGGASGAAHKAVDILRGAGSVAVFLAIVLSPVLLLVVLAWLALRARTRRVEARLLAEPRPGASTAERS